MNAVSAPVSRGRFAMDGAFIGITTLFFAWGFVAATIDVLIPSVRSVFRLTYAEAMLTQFAFFIAYGLMSLPSSWLLGRIGYANANVAGLGAILAGCLLVPVATMIGSYPLVLVALFVMATGTTLLQVAANPLVAKLGPVESSHARLNLSQAFNSAGTLLAPLVGSFLMLRGGVFEPGNLGGELARTQTLRNIDRQFLLIASVLAVLTALMWGMRGRISARTNSVVDGIDARKFSPMGAFKSRWAMAGALAIFCYVGAEVAAASLMISFLSDASVLGVAPEWAGRLLGLYWGGAMLGRFAGSAVMARVSAGRVLGTSALIAATLAFTVSQATGAVAAAAALSIGFFNSIMFPTIFTLTLERSRAPTAATSGLLCLAIVGGAVLPPLAGWIADAAGIAMAFLIPCLAYIYVGGFGLAAGVRAR